MLYLWKGTFITAWQPLSFQVSFLTFGILCKHFPKQKVHASDENTIFLWAKEAWHQFAVFKHREQVKS